VTGFAIERSDNNNVSWSQIDTAAANATTYTDSTVHEGSHYIYRLRATGAGAPSAASNTIGATPIPPPRPASRFRHLRHHGGDLLDQCFHCRDELCSGQQHYGGMFSVLTTLGPTTLRGVAELDLA